MKYPAPEVVELDKTFRTLRTTFVLRFDFTCAEVACALDAARQPEVRSLVAVEPSGAVHFLQDKAKGEAR